MQASSDEARRGFELLSEDFVSPSENRARSVVPADRFSAQDEAPFDDLTVYGTQTILPNALATIIDGDFR